LEHHSANQFLRAATNLNFIQPKLFQVLVKMFTASPIARCPSFKFLTMQMQGELLQPVHLMSLVGTKPPIWDVLATVATEGNPDMTRAAQFSRERLVADLGSARVCASAIALCKII
jgi:hypothetical protein